MTDGAKLAVELAAKVAAERKAAAKSGKGVIMSIYINKNTKVVVQGITGHQASFHTRIALDYGTNIVAGVTPGHGGEKF